ncbi:hypothetical protein [Paenibacillus radicis (ex Xue et al. 2023)]|uniref:Uncharacterized protein n=1 Tax=Paenibacillus radicis (ex Xue et al. 2023) TaxID=2972489 RepID=A0ABT1YKN3_9BACL|nr:hypothetical protein [Paenibacillus radicis (ex Xue et al. 2023)]MCR8632535.1 hypothetical protein [Paenibacillus radicis (ex Xue et al. 2023)]
MPAHPHVKGITAAVLGGQPVLSTACSSCSGPAAADKPANNNSPKSNKLPIAKGDVTLKGDGGWR